MAIEQVSVFIENQPGRLLQILSLLAEEGIDLSAYSVAETSDFGILRIIVHDTDAAVAALKSHGFTAKKTEVLGLLIPNKTGSSVQAVELLSAAGINIEYTYAFVMPRAEEAFVLLRVEDNAPAEQLLRAAGIRTLEHGEIF
ncbi:MAG: hypothetical protein LBJ11_02570 [Oscillospiraceae bacterium]|jgi:hypothetical protein|nr:hypothetical protein [Oscillospiraceae bacterium]